VFENRVLRRIFGLKRDEVTGGWRKLHNEELRNTERECVDRLGNRVHPMIQTFPKNDTVFQGDNDSIHTAGTVQSWLAKHEINFSISPGQHNRQISTSLNHYGKF
jgi:hypothetical protein